MAEATLLVEAIAPVAKTEVVAKAAKDRVVSYINDKSAIVYGKVDSVATYLQGQLPHSVNAKTARALEAFAHLLDMAKSHQEKSSETLVALRAWTQGKMLYVQGEILAGCKLIKEKARVLCIRVQTAVHDLPIPLKCKEQITIVGEQASAATIYVKDGIVHAYAKIGGAFVQVRVRLQETKALSKAKILETFERARPVAEAVMNRLQDRSILVKGKIDDAVVQIKANRTAARSKAMEECMRVYNALREALEGLPLDNAFITAATNKVQVLRSKLGDLPVHVKDGVVHATGQVEAGYVHVKASATEVKGSLKLRFLEAVSSAKSQCQDAKDVTMMKATEVHNTSKAAMEVGKVKVLNVIDYSKGVAADRKKAVAAGALIGVGAGGVTGLTAGTTAGAACGLLLAPFTLGLSVPIGAVIGGSTGTGIGAVAGTTLGAIGGGAANYASSNYPEIKQSILEKARLVSGTGGSDQDSGTGSSDQEMSSK